MTLVDRMGLLRSTVGELGQAETARRLGYSASALNQVLHGTYKGGVDAFLLRVEEVFGSTVVICPVLGEITLGRCADEKRRPFAATNPLRVRLWKACRECKKEGA